MRDTGITINLSADLGEGAPGEEEVWPLIDSANVACGGHVGDGDTMRDAVERSLLSGV
ncbi:MAG: LamB/YcsF family protein, partial [Acidobacteriota bacterium]